MVRATISQTAAICLLFPLTAGASEPLVYTDQGKNWSAMDRAMYYTQDQGSRLMPLSWLKALTLPDGSPFLTQSLSRYGYLPMTGPNQGLPVGFTSTGPAGREQVGMTCAACHTREIRVSGTRYRVDGGPALVDFHRLLVDLDEATQRLANDPAAFDNFAKIVLGPDYEDPTSRDLLKLEFDLWSKRFHAIVSRGVPNEPWGVGRLDAVGMIFNRLTGLDLGETSDRIIEANIQSADAPVRYPFLWNAAVQDRTQWPGFAANGSDILGLARNVGEVYGVFGEFTPVKDSWSLLGIDYLKGNSVNFSGLSTLEGLIKKLGPPAYPFPIDKALAQKGEAVFKAPGPWGSCEDCHGQRPGTPSLGNKTWATPLVDTGTDSHQYDVISWVAHPGVMTGARIPFLSERLADTSPAIDILTVAVEGSILQHYAPWIFDLRLKQTDAVEVALDKDLSALLPELYISKDLRELRNAFPRSQGKSLGDLQKSSALTAESPSKVPESANSPTSQFKYESRVLYGIWATAPYLHNGSVPTLAALLDPVDKRPHQFASGADYDPVAVGLASTQTGLHSVTVTTDCTDRNSGNSRCGHEFGTDLSVEDKAALLEYLKTL